jgi:hypothetical protein
MNNRTIQNVWTYRKTKFGKFNQKNVLHLHFAVEYCQVVDKTHSSTATSAANAAWIVRRVLHSILANRECTHNCNTLMFQRIARPCPVAICPHYSLCRRRRQRSTRSDREWFEHSAIRSVQWKAVLYRRRPKCKYSMKGILYIKKSTHFIFDVVETEPTFDF